MRASAAVQAASAVHRFVRPFWECTGTWLQQVHLGTAAILYVGKRTDRQSPSVMACCGVANCRGKVYTKGKRGKGFH